MRPDFHDYFFAPRSEADELRPERDGTGEIRPTHETGTRPASGGPAGCNCWCSSIYERVAGWYSFKSDMKRKSLAFGV